jgi:TRAP-type C4-dicarboxylate transport system permease small subunit
MYALAHRISETIARGLALAGGLMLVALVALNCVSIVGRSLVPLEIGIGPIRGIYDITEIIMAAAIFAFLPWCHLMKGHATVDLFDPSMPTWLNRTLDLVFNAGMLLVAVVGTWRLYLGMLDKLRFGETTLIAQIPVWYGYAAGLAGAAGFVVVAAFCVWRALRSLAGRPERV